MKPKTCCFFLFLVVCFSLFAACSKQGSETPDSGYIAGIPSPTPTFDRFASELFAKEISQDTISLHYSLSSPENYGISDYPITLGTMDGGNEEDLLETYSSLLLYDKEDLSLQEQLTYDVLKRHLDLLLSDNSSEYLAELLGPATGFQAQLPVLLAEYRFERIDDVKHYLALLPKVYDYFKELSDFELEKSRRGYFMTDECAKEIIDGCLEFLENPGENFLISTFEERLGALSLSVSEKTEYILANQNALYTYVYPAYELLVETLTSCLGTGENPYGLCYFDGGKEYYALLGSYVTGSDKSVAEWKEQLSNTIQTACRTMSSCLAKEPSLYTEALYPTYPETEPEAIIEYVKQAAASDFPSFDCGRYQVKYLPPSLQEYLSPAMYLTPPLDAYNNNLIYINPNPAYAGDCLFPTVVHEGYPGHMYQTVSCLSGDIHPLRYILAPTGYEEGWATYVENYCYRYAGLSETFTEFLQADQTATLCLYALSDILIHYEGYTPKELHTYLSLYGFSEEVSDLIYQTLLSEPLSYLPYAIGFLEFLELREAAKDLWGDAYTDYKYHSFLMETGPMPFSMLEELLINSH